MNAPYSTPCHDAQLWHNASSARPRMDSKRLPDEEVVGVRRLLETRLFDGIPPGESVENLQQSNSIRDTSNALERCVDHVRVHHLK